MNRIQKRNQTYDPYVQKIQEEQKQPQPEENEEENYKPSRGYHIERQSVRKQNKKPYDENFGFGDTRNPVAIATSVECNPTPPGICEIMIGGRPIDLHAFEDYLVWKVSPYQLRTLLRYNNVRTIEEVKNYAMRPSLKMKSGTIILIILAVLFLIGGIAIFMFMPQITEMFKGFV
jgi:hypothetical protein